MGRRKFTDEQLIALNDLGYSQRKIAFMLGVKNSTIIARMQSIGIRSLPDGIPKAPIGRPKANFTDEQLIALNDQHIGGDAICQALGVERSTVTRRMKLLGISTKRKPSTVKVQEPKVRLPKAPRITKPQGRPKKFTDQQLIELNDQCIGGNAICHALGIHHSTMTIRMRQLGISIKRKPPKVKVLKVKPIRIPKEKRLKPPKPTKVKVLKTKERKKKNGNYWDEEEMKNKILQYNEIKSEILLKEMIVKFQKMTETIWSRYFAKRNLVLNTRMKEVCNDAMTQLVLNLYYYNQSKGRSYSFCQTVIKNYFNTLVSQPPPIQRITSSTELYSNEFLESSAGVDTVQLDESEFLRLKTIYLKRLKSTNHLPKMYQTALPYIIRMVEEDRIYNPYYVHFILASVMKYDLMRVKRLKVCLVAEGVLPRIFSKKISHEDALSMISEYLIKNKLERNEENIFNAFEDYQLKMYKSYEDEKRIRQREYEQRKRDSRKAKAIEAAS